MESIQPQMRFIDQVFQEIDLASIHPILASTTLYALNTGGKRLRPLILALCAELVGGRYQDAKEVILALELIHNATLVHDDILDEDTYRRGKPSLYVAEGVKKAVLTGDALLSLGLKHAARTENPQVVHWLASTSLKMIEGISIQNQYKRRLMSVEEYLQMNYLKSGSLFEAAGALGALVGSGRREDVERLAAFGRMFGNAYQIHDDILDAFNEGGTNGKPNNDLINGDPSLLFLIAVKSPKIQREDRERLLSVFQGRSRELDIGFAARVYQDSGALAMAIGKMKEFLREARAIIEAYPDGEASRSLLGLLDQYDKERVEDFLSP